MIPFPLKPQLDSYVLDVVGGAGLQLRQGKDKIYIPYKLSNKVIDWKPVGERPSDYSRPSNSMA